MIFTRINIKNLYSFHDCEIDLTFKRKVKDSTVPFEFLKGRENFKYRRVCILSGANATGKTSFGKILCGFQNLIFKEFLSKDLSNGVTNKEDKGTLDIEFVSLDDLKLHRLCILLSYGEPTPNKILHASVSIRKNDSAITARNRLLSLKMNEKSIKDIKISDAQNWFYLLSNISEDNQLSQISEDALDKDLLFAILKSCDSSIVSVENTYTIKEVEKKEKNKIKQETKNEKSGFQIVFANGDSALIDFKGNATNEQRFSKGTFAAIKVADFIGTIRKTRDFYSTFFMDEQLAYSHSYMEVNLLNVMIQFLGRNSQLFFTTHNYDILDLDFPVHSYVFFSKREDRTDIIQPENTFKKNDRSLLNAVQNNVFGHLPDITKIDELLC